jgi:hypothetical protein
MIRLPGEDEIDTITNDVCLVIYSEIYNLKDLGLSPDRPDNIEAELVARVDHTFL